MEIVDLADDIFRNELNEPDDISIPNIVFWLLANIPSLNVLLGTNYVVDFSTSIITPELGDAESAILKYLYLIHYSDILIKSNLNTTGGGGSALSELSDGDTTIRWVSKNEIAKSYIQLKKSLEDIFNKMVLSYKRDGAVPISLSAAHNVDRFYRILN